MAQELEIAKKTTAKVESDAAKAIADSLRAYQPPPQAGERDELEGRYKIDLNAPLPEYDRQTAQAFAATDSLAPKRLLFALVCKLGTLQRNPVIQALKNTPHPNILPLITAGIVPLSRPEEERFVILFERPKGRKLSSLIAASKSRPQFDFMCHYIIAPISQAIVHMSELGFPHGSINPDNIYFDNIAMLGPCVAEPCGYSQPFLYEPLERMQAMPAGKGEGSSPQDYYALAVVVLQIIYGGNHFNGLTREVLMRSIMREGAFNALTRQKDMPEVFYDFFRGLLSQYAHDRWGHKYLKAWLDGKRYNVMPPPPPSEAMRPFEFVEDTANTRREVAHLFSKHLDDVPEALISGHLAQWVNISLRNKELSEYLTRMTKSMNSAGKKNDSYLDEQIMRLIGIFDPHGPVRIKELSFHINGIGALWVELVNEQATGKLQLLIRFIELSMYQFLTEQSLKGLDDDEEKDPDPIFAKLDRIRTIIRNKGLGFGIERVLYDLNPDMHCLSPLLKGRYVITLNALLRALDSISPTLGNGQDPIDAHMAAFIASKLNIQHEIKFSELETHPTLFRNQAIMALKLLASAQHKTGLSHLPGLTNWLAARVLPSLDVIRSKTLQKKLKSLVAEYARRNNTQKLADTMITSGYARAETVAFQQAIHSFKQNAIDILYYRKGDMLEVNSQRLGTIMAHYGALAALVLSFYLAMKGVY